MNDTKKKPYHYYRRPKKDNNGAAEAKPQNDAGKGMNAGEADARRRPTKPGAQKNKNEKKNAAVKIERITEVRQSAEGGKNAQKRRNAPRRMTTLEDAQARENRDVMPRPAPWDAEGTADKKKNRANAPRDTKNTEKGKASAEEKKNAAAGTESGKVPEKESVDVRKFTQGRTQRVNLERIYEYLNRDKNKNAEKQKNNGASATKPKKKTEKQAEVKKETSAKKSDTAAGTIQVPAPHKESGRTPYIPPKRAPREKAKKLRVFSLGGLEEIGKNMTVLEYDRDIIVIDCGMAFPDEEMPGIDLVIPDVSYLKKNADRVRGIFITHGHEDHIGALPFVLAELRVPVYGTKLTLGIVEGKIAEAKLSYTPALYTVEAGDAIRVGAFRVEFIHVNHSIADACALCVDTPVGRVFHTGDFKLDVSPIDGRMMDLCRIGELGAAGITLLLGETTNAERAGFTPSERTVGSSLERIFASNSDRRLIIATFSSNVHRVQQIIDASVRHGRKVAILGRSMVNVITAAKELGYMDFPEDCLIDVSAMKMYKPEQLTLITTGSQGEPMSALYRIAFGENEKVKLEPRDVVVLSSSAIPGNEKLVGKIINALAKQNVAVVNDAVEAVHVSGHACREEIKMMMGLTKPTYYMPIHGEQRHLHAGAEIAKFMGIPADRIFIGEIGKVLEIGENGAKWADSVPSGNVLVDGSGVGDIGSIVLRDRKHLSEDGLVVVVASVDFREGMLISGPDIVSRGFVYVKESEELVAEAKRVCAASIENALARGVRDFTQLKSEIRDDLSRLITQKTKRKPMILPVLMDI